MTLESLVKPLAYFTYSKILQKESQIGYKIILDPDPSRWIAGTMIADMTNAWHRFGLEAIGINRCSIGKIINGVSSRFDPVSDLYQSWLGSYTVQFSDSKDWTIGEHFRLCVADQYSWLKIYGVSDPVVEIEKETIKELGDFRCGSYLGQLYRGVIRSNTDVGANRQRLYLKGLCSGMAYYFQKSNPALRLNYTNFLPRQKEERLSSYAVINLEGYIAIINISKKTKAIFYVNGCNFIDKFGKKADTFNKLQKEFLEAIKKFRIIKIGSGNLQ